MTPEEQLDLISKAWGRRKPGDDTYYAFFPWIDREEQAEAGIRRAGYHEGTAFEWPVDREKILAHMEAHQNHDLYWCPSLFEYPERLTEWAVDEKALWADLDEVDPRTLADFQPTIAWQTSPGRYQALWLLNQGDIRGASWEGGENQRLTYAIGADESGWDTTQLLRIPGWRNHKLNYRSKAGTAPLGKLLWKNGRRYQADDFEDLPQLDRPSITTDVVVGEIDHTDRSVVMAKWRTKIPKRIRELLNAREPSGDRSDVLWDIERSLADIGCSVTEIVVIVRGTVWNKYDGRGDELKRLVNEAVKAIAQRPDDVTEALEEASEDKGKPTRWNDHFKNIKKPEMLIKGVLTKGKVGFIAGQPKSWKSWIALDMALSVSTGARYLDYFDILEPGPVLYIQVEDDPSTVKSRGDKIWRGKKADRVKIENGSVVWEPGSDAEFDPEIAVYMESGVTISDPEWQEWLADTLREGFDGRPYALMILDTLMMVAGDVEENRAQEMTTKIFRPLKALARDHGVAIQVVHHLRKGGDEESRGGQLMLGSVANHAWSEDSTYLRLSKTGGVKMEIESKFFPSEAYRLGGIDRGRGWEPTVTEWTDERKGGAVEAAEERATRNSYSTQLSPKQQDIMNIIERAGKPMTSLQIAQAQGYAVTGFTGNILKIMEKKRAISRTGERPMRWTAN